jgi:hypothetical protein
MWVWDKTGGRFIGKKVHAPALDASEVNDDVVGEPALEKATATHLNSEAKRRKAKVRQRP